MKPDSAVSRLKALQFATAPRTKTELDQRIRQIASALDVTERRVRVITASAVVAQMLPPRTIIKGGIGIKLRLGEAGTRATTDFDVAARDRTEFLDAFGALLRSGWGVVPPSRSNLKKNPLAPPRTAFTGVVRKRRQASPDAVPPAYLMQPYSVTLSYSGSEWAKVLVEVGYDELDGIVDVPGRTPVDPQIAEIGHVLQCGTFSPVPLIAVEHQIAQKIHATTEPGSGRAHDLVDLQLLWPSHAALDLDVLAWSCDRTFAFRRAHAWPPTVAFRSDLEGAYAVAVAETAGSVDVEATLAGATSWLQARVDEIARARHTT